MKALYLTKKNFEDLDLNFIFERLNLSSPYGDAAKRAIKPYLKADQTELLKVYDRTEATLALLERQRSGILQLKEQMKAVKQLDVTFDRIAEGETLSITELFEVKQLSMVMEKIHALLKTLHWEATVKDFMLDSTEAVTQLLDPENSGVSTFYIYSAYSSRLAEIRKTLDAVEMITKRQLNEAIQTLKSEDYPIMPNGELRVSARDQSLMTRVKSDPRFDYKSDVPMYSLFIVKGDEMLGHQKESLLLEEEDEELEVRNKLTETLKTHLDLLMTNTKRIGQIDLLIAKAQFSKAFGCVRPTLTEEPQVEIEKGRHLKVATSLERSGKKFTPITVSLKKPVALITGANMGGKTVSLKLIGQVVSLAQYGFFVPCEAATLPLFDFVFVSVGDFQSIDMGLSTFGGEIVEIQQALKRQHEFGLILIDELARGTNPLEGYAISKALIEYLSRHQSRAVITTHFDGLTEVEGTSHYQVNGLSGIDLDLIRDKIEAEGAALLHEYMDYQLSEVSSLKEIPKEALRISELMGLDLEVVNRAKEIMGGSHGK